MMDWLREPGIFWNSRHGRGRSQPAHGDVLYRALRDRLDSRRGSGQADAHHWLMLGGMVAMLGFFVSYYLFRQLGVLAFEGKEGFGGSQASTTMCLSRSHLFISFW